MAGAMGIHRICRFIFVVSIGISLSGGDFVKDTSLTITEHHPQYAVSPNQAIRQTITTWLTKALHK